MRSQDHSPPEDHSGTGRTPGPRRPPASSTSSVPDSSQPPSARCARARIAARSLPASGSDQACAQISSARAIGGSSRACCSLRAVPQQRGPEQEDPVLADPHRGGRGVVLVLERQPVQQRGVPAAVRSGPGHHREPGRGQLALPVAVRARTPRRCPPTAAGRPARGRAASPAPAPGRSGRRFRFLAHPPRLLHGPRVHPGQRVCPTPRRCARAPGGAGRTRSPCPGAGPSGPRTGSPPAWPAPARTRASRRSAPPSRAPCRPGPRAAPRG